MTVKELKEILDRYNEDTEIKVELNRQNYEEILFDLSLDEKLLYF